MIAECSILKSSLYVILSETGYVPDSTLFDKFNGILTGRGEFSSKSPKYCGGGKVLTRCLDSDGGLIISTVVNIANEFPSFSKLATRLGVSPIVVTLKS